MIFRNRLRLATKAGVPSAPESGINSHEVVLPAREKKVSGWYRLKVISPNHVLSQFRIQAFEKPPTPVYSFADASPQHRFVGYLYISAKIETIKFLIDLVHGSSDDLTVDLRPISLVEYIWHSFKQGFLYRPQKFLHHYLRPVGPVAITFKFPFPPRFANETEAYQWWVKNREPSITQAHLSIGPISVHEVPSISILMSVYDPEPTYLKQSIASVFAQTSSNWQLCIVDDNSTNSQVQQILEETTRGVQRVSLIRQERRGGICAATNAAFVQSRSPFVTCLGHEDILAPAAIEACARYLYGNSTCRLLFSDEDKIDHRGGRFNPYFKSRKFSHELFYSSNYLNRMTTYHAGTVREIKGWRSAYDGAQDHDLNLRVLERAGSSAIDHIPLVLYHVRSILGTPDVEFGSRSDAIEAGRQALLDHLNRCGVKAEVTSVRNTAMYRVRRAIDAPAPMVSILIPFRDRPDLLRRCMSSLLNKTRYKNFETILIDNGSEDPVTLELLKQYKLSPSVRIIHDPRPFNYSQLNNFAASQANGEYLCLLNNDAEVINEDWLDDMLSYATIPEVGCVGAKLYYPNGTVQHAGVVMGIGVAAHVSTKRTRDDWGYFGRLQLASNFSAVTGACLLVKRSIFMAIGGLDERELAISYNDIDFCLKVQAAGYRNIVTPFAELVHYESATRRGDSTKAYKSRLQHEADIMHGRYGELLQADPCYSPHLALLGEGFTLRLD